MTPARWVPVDGPKTSRDCSLARNEEPDSSPGKKADLASAGKRRRGDSGNVDAHPQIGNALRLVYDQTVDEAIPREMLDLLGRLG